MFKITTTLTLLLATTLGGHAQGAVIADPTLASGPNAIDPAGAETLDQTPATTSDGLAVTAATEASLEARNDFRVVQNFTGFGNTTNTIHFTDPTLPDIRFTREQVSATPNDFGEATSSDGFNTSAGAAIRLRNNSGGNKTTRVRFDFGSYDAGSDTWDGSVNAISAASINLINLSPGMVSAAASFYAEDGTLISQQTLTAGTDADTPGSGATDGLFALEVDGSTPLISYFDVRIVYPGGIKTVGLDDLGFTAIPEPASLALIGIGGLLMIRRGRDARTAPAAFLSH